MARSRWKNKTNKCESQSDSNEQAGVSKMTQTGSKPEEDLTEMDVLADLVRQACVLQERNKLVSTMTIKESLEQGSWVLHSAINKLKLPLCPWWVPQINLTLIAPNIKPQSLWPLTSLG